MKKKKWTIWSVSVVILFILILTIGLQYASNAKVLKKHAFPLTASIPVGTVVNFSQFKDESFAELFQSNRPKVIVFGRNECGPCFYLSFPLKEWVKKYRELEFMYIEMTNIKPNYLHINSKNFYLILNDPNKIPNLTDLFHVRFSPTIFFLNGNNRVVWKRSGFLITDYEDLESHLNKFSHNQLEFTDYQRNVVVGKKLPSIRYI